jgi:ABC-type anion transport system duplicated permease subunit
MDQYFNKLYITLMSILLVPILSFITFFILATVKSLKSVYEWPSFMHLLIFTGVLWVIQFIYFNKKIKFIPNDQGLGIKLKKYFHLTIVRYTGVAAGCLILLYGFYNTHDNMVAGLFAANLLLLGLLWPTSPKVCRDLKLRGDEHEMVYYKKDHF